MKVNDTFFGLIVRKKLFFEKKDKRASPKKLANPYYYKALVK
ncbi:MAG: hypothetical protein H6Q14_2046 [Bacteroidetes bacterium]|jgi:hypothetical protein|nr:hypothetical protein [Bacteroidota bacterium]